MPVQFPGQTLKGALLFSQRDDEALKLTIHERYRRILSSE
jgi:hypothetical protein